MDAEIFSSLTLIIAFLLLLLLLQCQGKGEIFFNLSFATA